MKKEFDCPSCLTSITFSGGESVFQTCESCHAPIIVPSEILYTKEQQIAATNFASLTNDIPVDVDQVTNELTPGDDFPDEIDLVDTEAKIEKFEVYQEKIGASSVESKKALDQIVTSSEKPLPDLDDSSILETPPVAKRDAVLEKVKSELRMGDKIEAIKIFRDFFQTSLAEAKETIEKMEKIELSGIDS